MTYNVKIEAFEGPFDLLFHLIEKSKIDIYDIPMTQITDQYVAYIEKMEKLNLEVTSEFLVMAATLIEIKSKMLLPIKPLEDQQLAIDDIDPRGELVRRLLEYKKYKAAAEELKSKEYRYQKMYFKPQEEIIFNCDSNKSILDHIKMEDLLLAIRKVLVEKHKTLSFETAVREMQREVVTIEDKMQHLLASLSQNSLLNFADLFCFSTTKMEIITTFMALLELIKLKKVIIKQDIPYGDITVELRRNHDVRGVEK